MALSSGESLQIRAGSIIFTDGLTESLPKKHRKALQARLANELMSHGSLLDTSREGIKIESLIDSRQFRFRTGGFANRQDTTLGALK